MFIAQSQNGQLKMGEYNAARFRTELKKEPGARWSIEKITPESNDQRAFFEGAVVPLVVYFQEGLDHRDWRDCKYMREELIKEFNGELKPSPFSEKPVKVAKSTKGLLNKGFLDRVIDWIEEQYGVKRQDVLNTKDYDYWIDVIYANGGPETFIDYLVSLKRL